MGRHRLVAAAAIALAMSGCAQPEDPIVAETAPPISFDASPTSEATTAASPDAAGMKAMEEAYDAFVQALGDNAEVRAVRYGVTKSVAWPGKFSEQAYVWENGAMTRTWERPAGDIGTVTVPLNLNRPEDLQEKLARKGACTKADDMVLLTFTGGFRLITATCNDSRGERTVQVASTGQELPPVHAGTKEGLTQLWSDMLTFGPSTYQIQQYEYVFTTSEGRVPGVYVGLGTIRTWRYAEPHDGQILSQTVTNEDLTGRPWIPFVRYNSNSFWTAYEATLAQCGSVDKLAVAFENPDVPAESVIVGTAGDCTLKVESTRTSS